MLQTLSSGMYNLAHRASIISLNGELEVAKYKNSVRYMTHRSSLVGISALTGGRQNPLLTINNKPPPLIRRADIERMTERLDSVLIDSQSSSSSIGNSNQNSARSSCYSASSFMEARSRKRSNFSWDSYKSNQTSMATIPLNRSSGSGICDSEVKRLRNRKRNRLKLLFGCCSRQTGAESDIENVSDSDDCAFNE